MYQEQTMTANETPPPLALTPPPDGKTRWGQERRLAFIDFRLQFERRLNRKDLRDFFGISAQQASLDLAAYAGLAPDLLRYDAKAKVYVPGEAFQPHYGCEDAGLYLKDILALGTDIIRRDASFIGWLPEFGIVPTLKRPLAASQLAEVLAAMRERRCLQISYQSMSRNEPSVRDISPHALGHDGFRWHVRAYCHKRGGFADFVFGRMLHTAQSAAAWVGGSRDTQWHTDVHLDLIPNPALSPAQRAAIALDYGMVDGHTRVSTREALLFYTLKRLGLNKRGDLEGTEQHIVLANKTELAPYLNQEVAG
jgi:hypothetical protein